MHDIYTPVASDLQRIKPIGIIIEIDSSENIISSVIVMSTDITSITA